MQVNLKYNKEYIHHHHHQQQMHSCIRFNGLNSTAGIDTVQAKFPTFKCWNRHSQIIQDMMRAMHLWKESNGSYSEESSTTIILISNFLYWLANPSIFPGSGLQYGVYSDVIFTDVVHKLYFLFIMCLLL